MNLSAAPAEAKPRLDVGAPESPPSFVISLDFELRWGMHDRLGLDRDAYRSEIEGEREVVPMLLDAFSRRNIHATWATVGALGCRDWNEYFARAPKPPKYEDTRHAVDPRYGDLDPQGTLHFAPELVEKIRSTPGQDLGTHTFSHIPLKEPGVSAEDVEADLSAAVRLWSERFDSPPRSLTFPRNQVAFVDVVRSCGIRVWRGNPRAWFQNRHEEATNRRAAHVLRLLDDLSPWPHRSCALDCGMTRASLFLRLDLPEPLWRLHASCIRSELTRLEPGEIFHLWWHPHNLGADVAARLGRVEEILDLAGEEMATGRLRSCSMRDLES